MTGVRQDFAFPFLGLSCDLRVFRDSGGIDEYAWPWAHPSLLLHGRFA